MRTKMIRLHMPYNPPPCLISIDVQRVQELAHISQWGEFLDGVRAGGLNAEVEEPGVNVGGWGGGEDAGEKFGDEWVHYLGG